MKLYELPKGARILGEYYENGNAVTIIFDHVDGMYSYCYDEAKPEKVIHLSANTPVRKVTKGYVLDIAPLDAEED